MININVYKLTNKPTYLSQIYRYFEMLSLFYDLMKSETKSYTNQLVY